MIARFLISYFGRTPRKTFANEFFPSTRCDEIWNAQFHSSKNDDDLELVRGNGRRKVSQRRWIMEKTSISVISEPVEIRLPALSESGTVWLASFFFFPSFLRTYHQETVSIPLPDFVVGSAH